MDPRQVARQLRAGAIALVLAISGTAVADQATPRPPAVAQAKELLRQGATHAQRGDYQHALVAFLEAHRLWGEGFIFFNIAEAYRLSGDKRSALRYYKEFVRAEPNHVKAASAKNWIVQITLELDDTAPSTTASSEVAPPDLASPTPPAPVPAAPTVTPEVEPPVAQPLATPPAQPEIQRVTTQPEADDRGGNKRSLRYAGIGVAAGGLISLVVGIKFGLNARSVDDDLNRDRPWTDAELANLPDRIDEGESAETKFYVFSGLGVAAIATGTVLYFASRDRESSPTALRVVPSGRGMALAGAF